MARMTVGGRPLDLTREIVERKMRGQEPEPIREHLVKLLGTAFPPKQVLATVTGWDRTSFTTMEAQRVLTKVGFACRRVGGSESGFPEWAQTTTTKADEALEDRVAALSAALIVSQQAIAGLAMRVSALESGKR